MNTYNENLRVAVNNALSAIEDTEQQRDSAVYIAHSNLYYAVGAQILATDKLNRVNTSYDDTLAINDQGVSCSNRANNLLDTATLTNDNVSIMVTNTATAAQNTQVAANAVVKLAAEIGSASNIVNASEYDNDIYRLTEQVNDVIKQTSYQAEYVSNISMDSSADSAQITAQQVLDEATATQTWFTDMLARTSAQLDTLTQLRITDTETLIAANTEQRLCEGQLKSANKEFKAVVQSYETSINELNYDLKATDKDAYSAIVRFDKMVSAFPFEEGSDSLAMDNGYYIGVKKYDTKDMFTLDIATTSFSSYYTDSSDATAETKAQNRFIAATPGTDNDIKMGIQALDSEPSDEVNEDALLYDVDGDLIVPGTKYVVFLYIVLDDNYKKYLNNYDDALSAASQEFVLTTKLLPVCKVPDQPALQLVVTENTTGAQEDIKVTFQVKSVDGKTDPTQTEYRAILVPNESLTHDDLEQKTGAFEAEHDVALEALFEQTDIDPMNIWFDKDVAEQVADVNYRVAVKADDSDEYVATFGEFATDNFGQLLNPKREYVVWVLSIITDVSGLNPDAYTSQLTRLDTASCDCVVTEGDDDGQGQDDGSTEVVVEEDNTTEQIELLIKDRDQAIEAKVTIEKDHRELTIKHNKLSEDLASVKALLAEKEAEVASLKQSNDDSKSAPAKSATRTPARTANKKPPANNDKK